MGLRESGSDGILSEVNEPQSVISRAAEELVLVCEEDWSVSTLLGPAYQEICPETSPFPAELSHWQWQTCLRTIEIKERERGVRHVPQVPEPYSFVKVGTDDATSAAIWTG